MCQPPANYAPAFCMVPGVFPFAMPCALRCSRPTGSLPLWLTKSRTGLTPRWRLRWTPAVCRPSPDCGTTPRGCARPRRSSRGRPAPAHPPPTSFRVKAISAWSRKVESFFVWLRLGRASPSKKMRHRNSTKIQKIVAPLHMDRPRQKNETNQL